MVVKINERLFTKVLFTIGALVLSHIVLRQIILTENGQREHVRVPKILHCVWILKILILCRDFKDYLVWPILQNYHSDKQKKKEREERVIHITKDNKRGILGLQIYFS